MPSVNTVQYNKPPSPAVQHEEGSMAFQLGSLSLRLKVKFPITRSAAACV